MDFKKLLEEIDLEIQIRTADLALLHEARRVLALLANREPISLPEGFGKKRRGRKSMNEKQRAEVSERMKRYWANWRKTKSAVR